MFAIASSDDDGYDFLIDESDLAMFQFAAWVSLGVDVSRLFQFERAVKSDGIVRPASKENEVKSLRILPGGESQPANVSRTARGCS
jgi:hypothetical protein